MIVEYRKKSNNHGLCFLFFAFLAGLYQVFFPNHGNIWDEVLFFPIACMLVAMYCFWIFLYMHFKAKGYHWSISLVATISGTVIPILIPFIYLVPDKYPIEF